MHERTYAVYIVTNERNGTLYVGVTSDLHRRIYEHKQKIYPGFTKKYNLTVLVYAELHPTAMQAIEREKRIKRWLRPWKLDLIESINPEWKDLAYSL